MTKVHEPIRVAILQALNNVKSDEGFAFETYKLLHETIRLLELDWPDTEEKLKMHQAVLVCFHDLYRNGTISFGKTADDPSNGHCFLTDRGKRVLDHLSRDPMNPEGYKEHLLNRAPALGEVAKSYIFEAVETYNAACYKATAILTGVAAERMLFDLRDVLLSQMERVELTPDTSLTDWKPRPVLKSVYDQLNTALRDGGKKYPKKNEEWRGLRRSMEDDLNSFLHHIRTTRNETGHPPAIYEVDPGKVHGDLLTFPGLAELVTRLQTWVANHYVNIYS